MTLKFKVVKYEESFIEITAVVHELSTRFRTMLDFD